MLKVKKDIEKRSLKKVYVWTGDKYLIDLYIDKILSIYAGEQKVLNTSISQGKDIDIKEIIDQSQVIPFLADKRVILVKDSQILTASKKDEGDYLKNNLSRIPDTAVIIFIEEEIDKRNGLYKYLNKEGSICEFGPLSENQLVEWIIKEGRNNSCEITREAALYFIRYVRGDMTNMTNELRKCFSYVGTGNVSIDVINDICHQSIDVIIFKLMEEISKKEVSKALNTYKQLLLTKEPAYKIFAMIIRQITLLLMVKEGLEKKMSVPEIAKVCGVMDFAARELTMQCDSFTLKQLLDLYYKCTEVDRNVKTGAMHIETAIELFIAEIKK